MMCKTWIGYNKVHHKKAKLKSVDRALSACTKCGFSLVEMLMALLVASLLMAALAPVMTRKMHENLNINVNSSGQSKGWRLYTYSQDCDKAEGEDNVCEFKDFTLPKGVYSLNLIMVSGGGGGAGATAETVSAPVTITKTTADIKDDNTPVPYEEEIIPVTERMANVKIDALIGSGGGGAGGSGKDGVMPSEEACKNYGNGKTDTVGNTGANFATYDSRNKLCATKFNQVKMATAAGTCWTNYSPGTCDSVQRSMKYAYSGCGRAVCNYTAAVNACSNLASLTGDDWRLPKENELRSWDATSARELALCNCGDNAASIGVSLCHGACSVNVSGRCLDGYIVWSNSSSKAFVLSGGSISIIGSSSSWPASVRCVLDKAFKSIKGGKGAPASMLSNIDISNYVKLAGTGGQIVLRAGKGGKGGNGAETAEKNAENGYGGYRSCIYIQKKPISGTYGDTVYAMCAYEGNGGNKGDIAEATDGKDVDNTAYCREYINGNWKDIGCSINTNLNYGTGGAGGSAIYNSDGTITMQNGSNGAGGLVKITYQNEFKGAGGGGGAGGTFAKITNLSLPNDTECVIKVGGGGNYGSGQNGKDGGNTSIKCGNSKEYIVYGGKGGSLGISGKDINNPDPVGGKGGAMGKVSENILQLGTLAEIIYGEGINNNTAEETAFKINGNLNIGGNGGNSGTNAIGGCGGLRPDNDPDGTNINQNATLAEYITPLYSGLMQETPDYGKTGAGGGGGGWSKTQSPKQGTGSAGQAGYLFLWWDQT